jgi:hypothetical protein
LNQSKEITKINIMSDCKKCNPCREGKSPSDEYLLVKASASTASTCEPTDAGSNASCSKQEDTFDEILNGFIMPISEAVANVNVCNSSVYSVGQWIQFLNPAATFQIVGINDNNLSIVNRCDNGQPIGDNPVAGATQFQPRSRFSVVGRPRCSALSEDEEDVQNIISGLTQLCMPSLAESNQDSDIHPVGRVETDPQDVNFGKCIKRIYGMFFRKGVPFFPAIKQTSYTNLNALSRLMINKSDKSIIELPKLSEDPDIVAGSNYVNVISPNQERLIGPTKIYIPTDIVAYNLGQTGGFLDSPAPTFVNSTGSPNAVAGSFDLSSSSLNALFSSILNQAGDFIAEFEFFIQINEASTNAKNIHIQINNELIYRMRLTNSYWSIHLNKKITMSSRNQSIPFEISQVSTNRAFGATMRAKLVGLYV